MNQENETQKKESASKAEAVSENQPEQAAGAPEQAAEESKQAENTEKQDAEKPEQAAKDGPTSSVRKSGQKKHSARRYFQSTKFRRGSVSTAFTAGFIVIVVLINVVVGILGERFPSINLDLTKDSTNTLSEDAVKVVDSVKSPTTIYILAPKESVMNDSLFSSYGIQYSQVGNLCAKIAERNSKIKVEYVDLDKKPTFVNDYKNDNLTVGDVLVKSDKRYRVLSATTDLFTTQYSSDYSSQQTYSNVNGALASALNAVNSDELPIVAFDTGHNEKADMSSYKKLLGNNSFDTKDVNLLTEDIPEKTQMLVLGYPTTDYTKEEIEKLDKFLSDTSLAADRSLMITFYPSQIDMPNLSNFLKEWGIGYSQAAVLESNTQKTYMNNQSYILSDVQSSLQLNSDNTQYSLMLTPQSVPINLLYSSKGSRATYSLLKSSETSYLVDNNTKEGDNPEKASYNTAALSQDTIKSGDKSYHANIIAIGSSLMFYDEILNASTFGDGKYMLDLSKYATGTTNAKSDVSILPTETNVADITLSAGQSNLIGAGVFMILIPLAIAVSGFIVYRRRRDL